MNAVLFVDMAFIKPQLNEDFERLKNKGLLLDVFSRMFRNYDGFKFFHRLSIILTKEVKPSNSCDI